MVAKSYQSLPLVCDPYVIGTRTYVKVKKSNGDIIQIRYYSEEEYKKYYGESSLAQAKQSQKESFGFTDGYITIIAGDSYPFKDFLKAAGAKFNKLWGWYFASGAEIPQLAATLKAIRLDWEVVGQEDGLLKADSVIKAEILKLTQEPSNSKFVGEIGERIEIEVDVKKAIPLNNYYGNIIFTFEDDDENIYVWRTTPRPIEVGTRIRLRGTIKAHNIFNEVQQTILSHCIILDKPN